MFVCLIVSFQHLLGKLTIWVSKERGMNSPLSYILTKAWSTREACQAERWGDRAFWLAHSLVYVQWHNKSSLRLQSVQWLLFAGVLRNMSLRNVKERTYSNKTNSFCTNKSAAFLLTLRTSVVFICLICVYYLPKNCVWKRGIVLLVWVCLSVCFPVFLSVVKITNKNLDLYRYSLAGRLVFKKGRSR